MSISVTCKQCGKRYEIADKQTGKRIECRLCGETLDISSAAPPTSADPRSDSSSPTDGASDKQLRIGAAFVLVAMLIGMAVCVATFKKLDTNHLSMIVFGPFGAAYALATLIDPNLVRAAGRYGGHLPFRYKLISGLIGLAALACSLLMAKILLMP